MPFATMTAIITAPINELGPDVENLDRLIEGPIAISAKLSRNDVRRQYRRYRPPVSALMIELSAAWPAIIQHQRLVSGRRAPMVARGVQALHMLIDINS